MSLLITESFFTITIDLPIYTIIVSSITAHTAVGTGPYSTVITARTLEDGEQSHHLCMHLFKFANIIN